MNEVFRQDPRLLDLMSVKYYVDGRFPRHLLLGRGEKIAPGSRKVPRVFAQIQENALARKIAGMQVQGGFPAVYERASAMPRTYIVHALKRAESEEQALEWVRALDFDPRRFAIVNEDIGPLGASPADASESASIAEYRAQRVRVDADCATACLLVLTDLYDAKWRVTVDGVEAPLRQVNFLFRGVELTPGNHQVRFVYHPAAFRKGLLVSCASLAIFVVLSILSWRLPGDRHRR
jgi:hypothetical protein